MSIRAYHQEDADLEVIQEERLAVLGYGIQGRAQALNLRDSGLKVVVGNRDDHYAEAARNDDFQVLTLAEAAASACIVLFLLPDEIQPRIFKAAVRPHLQPGNALVLAHGFSLRYRLIEPPREVDVLLLAPRMPGQYVRSRYLRGWGVPAFVSVEQDATGRGRERLLALATALGVTRCGALEVTAAQETELDHFSEHFLYPTFFSLLETTFELLVEAGYPPEAALMELHGSGELGEVLKAASQQGLYRMISSHASPACQVGIAHHWKRVGLSASEIRRQVSSTLDAIRDGLFARFLQEQHAGGYPELKKWSAGRSQKLVQAEKNLRKMLRGPARDRPIRSGSDNSARPIRRNR